MLWTIFVILIGLWLISMVANVAVGGLIHLLLVFALVVVIVRLVRGRV